MLGGSLIIECLNLVISCPQFARMTDGVFVGILADVIEQFRPILTEPKHKAKGSKKDISQYVIHLYHRHLLSSPIIIIHDILIVLQITTVATDANTNVGWP